MTGTLDSVICLGSIPSRPIQSFPYLLEGDIGECFWVRWVMFVIRWRNWILFGRGSVLQRGASWLESTGSEVL